MDPSSRIAHYPRSLRERCRLLRLGPAPALVVHPDGERPAPTLVWLHGRTANKELDSARYQRLVRAGVAVVALDLPGHGERADEGLSEPGALGALLAQARAELDPVLEAIEPALGPAVDLSRLALGGMSAGGMVALRRLCEPHPFVAVAVEGTTGDFAAVGESRYAPAVEAGLSPAEHLAGWRPIPFLALHSEADRVVPVGSMRRFVERLRAHCAALGSDSPVRLETWPETGAPEEHLGFGRRAADARRLHVEFLTRHLRPGAL
ncbi:MAG: alpha/beta fold hydrolase [Planctomycetes bacterium]|nr:alpha/beta fold hydrolase [Planctomycetota bacterium]